MITTKGLSKIFGAGDLEVVALRDISLDIHDGEFISIIGPSGAGKSTLLYQVSLLDEPTAGEIIFDGMHTSQLTQAAKTSLRLERMGFVFQDYALLPELTALENVALPLLMQGLPEASAYAAAEKALRRIGLADRMQSLPSQLSGGQQQRVSIARAISHNPHVLFADEPTANLDSANASIVIDAFLELHQEGQTIVMVTHEDEYAKKASRIISMKDGVIVDRKG